MEENPTILETINLSEKYCAPRDELLDHEGCFSEALVALREERKKLSRKGWIDKKMYIFCLEAISSFPEEIVIRDSNGDVTTWSPSQADLLSQDWGIVE
tara:strand:- start:1951 stop:2247 length:297 start_codon:yes stop_codon:yes gene_type:complete